MPTYVVTAVVGRFSADQKSRLASIITEVHCTNTGAPAYLAQVIFNEVPAGNYFVGGKLLKFDNIYIHAHIREGRGARIKEKLLLELLHCAAAIGETDRSCVQVYLVDVPARQIAEWGQILPNPGEESAWETTLPDTVKQRIKALSS